VAPLAAIKEIFMPALSSTMTEGKVVTWLKSPGDKITKGESVVVVESDKADMDVESFTEGFLGGIVIQEGGVANVGEALPAFDCPDCPDRFDAFQVMRSRLRRCALRSALLTCEHSRWNTPMTTTHATWPDLCAENADRRCVCQNAAVAPPAGEPIAYVAETEGELDEARSKASGGSSGNGAAAAPPPPPPKAPAAEAAAPAQACFLQRRALEDNQECWTTSRSVGIHAQLYCWADFVPVKIASMSVDAL